MNSNKPNIAVFGNGGREAAIAISLQNKFTIFGVSTHYSNITVKRIVEKTNGKLYVDNNLINNINDCIDWLKNNNIQRAIVQNESYISYGLVDILENEGIKTFGASSEASELYWDKSYAFIVLDRLGYSKYIPDYKICNSPSSIQNYILRNNFENIVVKPLYPSKGKEVKIGNKNFTNCDDMFDYAYNIVKNSKEVILQEIVNGMEFNIIGITDGENVTFCPPTYNYHYLFNNDEGPYTNGMGCITMKQMPFLNDFEISICHKIMVETINYMALIDKKIIGCLNGKFIKTANGIKFINYNTTLTDPEVHNCLALMGDYFSDHVEAITNGRKINVTHIEPNNTMVAYIVHKNYSIVNNTNIPNAEFYISDKYNNDNFRFDACIQNNDCYESLGASKVLAIMAPYGKPELWQNTIQEARKFINNQIEEIYQDDKYHYLTARNDIGILTNIPTCNICIDGNPTDYTTRFFKGIFEACGLDVDIAKTGDLIVNTIPTKNFIDYNKVKEVIENNFNNCYLRSDRDYKLNDENIISIPVLVFNDFIKVFNQSKSSFYGNVITSCNCEMVTKLAIELAKSLKLDNGIYTIKFSKSYADLPLNFIDIIKGVETPDCFVQFGSYANADHEFNNNINNPIWMVQYNNNPNNCRNDIVMNDKNGHSIRYGYVFERL